MNTTQTSTSSLDFQPDRFQPDIIVVSPDGEYLMLVEIKLTSHGVDQASRAIAQLKQYMVGVGCPNGLLIWGETIMLLWDSFEQSDGRSIQMIGEAKLPDTLLPPTQHQSQTQSGWDFATRVQQWMEGLTLTTNVQKLPEDLQHLFSEPILNLLRMGEIRSGGPRWSQVT
ncbi:type I restriction enzyme HsdR N-terminal domain-containing protein [Limnothrix sp. FACHB-708]|uniref:type I restriction enzyme HsdR N-terminal domain-containing protein n=1 Tax=unclassified Limnothrix TaxID=2632864 RepID=UPI0016847254|nr:MULTISPECIES: type I restriction enzyme HsdR N-terminal domain-containing protein [unclassified Limnothrix]MBD2552131.1 type I restriction enzyme HsdR N-terminal domain-containing protein [Limnothrix sp. FACHB-708]MBD2592349.1 type I restriction enzyme HsdR N-terminal domain-containing protein [Limnothrix sp. FACHB-406]